MKRKKAIKKKKDKLKKNREKNMTFEDHLEELRKVILYCLGILLVFMVISLIFGKEVHSFFSKPYKNILGEKAKFYQIKITAPFIVYLKTSFMVSFLIGFPIFLSFIWSFIAPAFDKKIARYGLLIIIFSTFLFWGGILLCWYSAFENLLKIFLITFRPPDIEAQLPVDEYYNLFFNLHLVFGLCFQIPIILILLSVLEIIHSKTLTKRWREITVILAFMGALLSPGPDIFSMMILFIPLIALFIISIFLVKFIEKMT